MKVQNYKKYACFDYVSKECNNPLQLGDVVIKRVDYEGEVVNEIGVVLQVHDDTEVRTDMFGNECNSMLKLATLEEIQLHRPKIFEDLVVPKNKQEDNKALITPRKFRPHDTSWDFVEEYYPNYSSADNICRALDLFLKKEQNGDTLSDEEDEELTYIMEDVYQVAINAFIQSQNK